MKGLISRILAVAFVVATAMTAAPAFAADGATLYGTNCQGCHGALANSSVKGATASLIQGAIDGDLGGMGFLKTILAATDVSAIAAALSPTPPPAATITLSGSVTGSTANLSWTKANLTGVSSFRVLRNAVNVGTAVATATSYANTGLANGTYTYEVDALGSTGAVLAKSNVVSVTVNVVVIVDGPTLYATYCQSCHGSLATSSKKGRTATQIQTAINNNAGGMGYLSILTPAQVQAIATALVVTVPPPAATITLSGSVTGSTANLSWTKANLTGVSSFRVLRNA
ncbi:MAG TPA: cytochrome c, partial [Nitrospirota bacterium]